VLRQSLAVTCAAALSAVTLSATLTPSQATPGTAAPLARVNPAAAARSDAAPAPRRHISYREWWTPRALRRGAGAGVAVRSRGVRISRPVGRMRYADPEGRSRLRYEFGRWVSPWVRPGFALTESVPSWAAVTPRGTWVQVEMRVRSAQGRRSSWDTMARWASHARRFHRMTLGEQSDDLTRVAADTLRSRGVARLQRWQLRVTLFRRAGTSRTPWLRGIGAMASRLPGGNPATARTTMRRTRVVPVPRRSQMIHTGHYRRYGNGGEAWCSPTSTTMLLRRWGTGPTDRQTAWVGARHKHADVDHAARFVYDYGYNGAGNWAFNTAYANTFGLHSFVTRLRSLREAEAFVRRGIPLVASVRFGAGDLRGAPISATNGHLMVIRGFQADGDVVVNDPAARRARGVRRVYDRAQFTDAWVGGSGGLVYVIRPRGRELPNRRPEANW
jgi:hypothetical protein